MNPVAVCGEEKRFWFSKISSNRESTLCLLSLEAEWAKCILLDAETKSDSGEAYARDSDHSFFSSVVDMWTILGADTKSDSGEANDNDFDQVSSLLSVAESSAVCLNLEAETKSDSGEAKDKVFDHVGPEVTLLIRDIVISGNDTKSDSGDAKDRELVQLDDFLCLEDSEAVEIPLKSVALLCLMAFGIWGLSNIVILA